jgi:hypothetical protein
LRINCETSLFNKSFLLADSKIMLRINQWDAWVSDWSSNIVSKTFTYMFHLTAIFLKTHLLVYQSAKAPHTNVHVYCYSFWCTVYLICKENIFSNPVTNNNIIYTLHQCEFILGYNSRKHCPSTFSSKTLLYVVYTQVQNIPTLHHRYTANLLYVSSNVYKPYFQYRLLRPIKKFLDRSFKHHLTHSGKSATIVHTLNIECYYHLLLFIFNSYLR